MQESYAVVAEEFAAVDSLIYAQLESSVPLVIDISQHLVKSGGKRIRPLVTLLIAGALNDPGNESQVRLATAIEFLHTATLLHDDVVDMSLVRRGQPTANANWGNASSVLVGDFVYSRAFELLVSIGNLEIMEVLSQTTSRIAEGEVEQLGCIGDVNLDEETYYRIIHNKTAELFAGACHSAALSANVSPETVKQARLYGQHLGMAFQLVDDFLDYAGNETNLGKQVGDDLAEGKLTLPLIEALHHSRENSPADYQQLVDTIESRNRDNIAEVMRIIEQSGGLEKTRAAAIAEVENAERALEGFADTPHRQQLHTIARFVLNRSH